MVSSLRQKMNEASVMVKGEVLGHLELVDHLADPQRDLVPPAQRLPVAAGGCGDLVQLFFGGGQQLVAFGARSTARAGLRQHTSRSPG